MASKGTKQIRVGRVKRKVEEFAYWERMYTAHGETVRAETVGAVIASLVEEFGEDVLPQERGEGD